MPRVALGLEYDGTAFAGWQVQPDQRTVQACVEAAVSTVADHPVQVVCAGRTDAGVHAAAQVVHFDSDADRKDWSWVQGANANLPGDVGVRWARTVPGDFHARYTATSRSYRYMWLNRESRPGLLRNHVTWMHRPLDERRMHEAAQALLGEHDFSAYRARDCQARSPVRDVQAVTVTRSGHLVVMDIRANAYLHHMVRNIAGVLMRIGTGTRTVTWAAELLAGGDRAAAAATAPPHGLYLVAVAYPPGFGLPDAPRFDMMLA